MMRTASVFSAHSRIEKGSVPHFDTFARQRFGDGALDAIAIPFPQIFSVFSDRLTKITHDFAGGVSKTIDYG